MGKRGPTPRPQSDLRSVRVSVYLTEAEAAELDDLRGGVGRGRWLRQAGLGIQPKTVPAVNRKAWAELARLAANFHQYQYAINLGFAPVAADLTEIRAAVDALRRDLVGVSFDETKQPMQPGAGADET